jgi:hypothetical protein
MMVGVALYRFLPALRHSDWYDCEASRYDCEASRYDCEASRYDCEASRYDCDAATLRVGDLYGLPGIGPGRGRRRGNAK